MNFKSNKIIKGLCIFSVTLLSGFGITALSFNLFDVLTQNQMRLLFAVDVLLIMAIGTIVWFIFESGKVKKKKQKEFEERHNERVNAKNAQMKDIEIIIAKNKYAA